MAKDLFSIISKEMKDKPVVSTILVGLFLVVFEKMLDLEFVCPCLEENYCNGLFVFLYFFGPSLGIFVLMCHVYEKSCCSCHGCSWYICSHTVGPPLTWIIILLLDGRYVACALTNWSGMYEVTGGGVMRWCQSENHSSERLNSTHKFYTTSQFCGLGLCILFGVIVSCCWRKHCIPGNKAVGIICTVFWVPICYLILFKLEKKPSDQEQQSQKAKKQDETEVNLSLVEAGPSSQTASQGKSD